MSNKLPTLRYENGSSVIPGDRIGSVSQVFPGVGTYAKGGHVYASLLGQVYLNPSADSALGETRSEFTVSIVTRKPLASSQIILSGQIVLGRVQRVTAPQAVLEILAIEGVGTVESKSEGTIAREECVKSGAAAREVHDCFQPGDLVLARVLSLGDSRRYFLTTAESELGVIHAICHSSGKPMIPYTWKEMQCPDSNVREPRKCAKPRKILKPTQQGIS
jgi:exosome complex component CSL4